MKEDEDSFYVLDVGTLLQQFNFWKEQLPTIQPYYAVKCNNTSIILETLSSLGVFFDCASKEEIKDVLNAGAKPDEIIYANPSKPISHLKFAETQGIPLMTFDSFCEIEKVKNHFPSAKLVLRIRVDVSEGSCIISFSKKFGCEPESAFELIQYASNRGLDVVGISFHVGTGCSEPEAYARGIHTAANIFKQAKNIGINMQYLDIGGGFPGDSRKTFEKIACLINESLKQEADILKGVTVIAEPGRYFVCNALTLAASIISLRETESHNEYYINNGVYSSFNCVTTEHTKFQPTPLNEKYGKPKKSEIWGQTTDEYDKVVEECWLPEMKHGDWLYFTSIGAYSTCLAIKFHGYSIPEVYPIIHEDEWLLLQEKKRLYKHN